MSPVLVRWDKLPLISKSFPSKSSFPPFFFSLSVWQRGDTATRRRVLCCDSLWRSPTFISCRPRFPARSDWLRGLEQVSDRTGVGVINSSPAGEKPGWHAQGEGALCKTIPGRSPRMWLRQADKRARSRNLRGVKGFADGPGLGFNMLTSLQYHFALCNPALFPLHVEGFGSFLLWGSWMQIVSS